MDRARFELAVSTLSAWRYNLAKLPVPPCKVNWRESIFNTSEKTPEIFNQTKPIKHYMKAAREKILEIENKIQAFAPDNKRADAKILLDKLMPIALILLGSLATFHFFIPVNNQLSNTVQLVNLGLLLFFTARLALAFSLAKSHKNFLKQHWFDVLLIIPVIGLFTDLKLLAMIESEVEEKTLLGFLFARSTLLAGQIARVYTWIRRIVRL